jgi:inositol-phosphate phosphatase/L-galactose 1-phosphate phosphatase/histidinol-phosphatase
MGAAAELDAAAALAPALADAAGAIIRRYFRQNLAVIDKPDLSPVTIADRDSEAAIRALIAQRFPHHGVIGEELGADRPEAEFVWVLDPIDGTKSFISGVPLFGTLIALVHQGRAILGVLDQPISRERWLGIAGRPSTHNGTPIRTRACAGLTHATLFTTAPDLFHAGTMAGFERVRREVKLTRYGADCYAYGLVALGCIDTVMESGLKPHDYCALIPIIEGAGGIVTNWQGVPAGLTSGGDVIASGDRALHEAILALVG